MNLIRAGSRQNKNPRVQSLPFDSLWNLEQTNSHLIEKDFIGFRQAEQWVSLILFFKFSDILEVGNLLTWPKFRKAGHMEKLLQKLIEENSSLTIWLDVHENNRSARGLYEKLGFQVTGVRPRYYSDGGNSLLLERKAGL